VNSNGAIGGGRPSVRNVDGWLDASLGPVESAIGFGRALSTAMRDVIRRWLSGYGLAKIHVSRMSDSWLRIHETDYDKHPPRG
jgi:hypothetical protein